MKKTITEKEFSDICTEKFGWLSASYVLTWKGIFVSLYDTGLECQACGFEIENDVIRYFVAL